MRLTVLAAACCLITPCSWAQIALLTEFDHPPAPDVTTALQSELTALLSPAGTGLILLRDKPYLPLGTPRHVLYATFTGHCEFVPQVAPRSNQRVLARLAVVDGKIQPLMTVDCDAVAQFITPYMTTSSLRQADTVYGRALARVVAHEILHWVAHQVNHSHSELFSESISARALLAHHAAYTPEELRLLRVSR